MKETIDNIKEVYKYGKEYKKNLIGMIMGVIFGTIIGVIVPILVAKQIVYFTSSEWKQLVIISFVILGIQAYNAFGAMFFTRRNHQYFSRGTMKNLQIKLGKEILNITQKEMDKNSSGVFIQRIMNDTEKMADYISWGGLDNIRQILANIGALFATLIINRQVFLYYLFVTIVLTIVNIKRTKKYGKKDIQFRNKSENVSGLIGELVRGIKDIKILNAKKSFMIKLEENILEQNQKRFEMVKINMMYKYIIDTLKAVFEFGLIILLIYLVQNNTISIAIAIALFNYKSGIMTTVMEKVSNLLDLTKSFNISCNRVFSILNDKSFEKEIFRNRHLSEIQGNVEFKNVTFGYTQENMILKNLNLKLNSREMIGIIGKSGAGKTTIFNLLCRMYTIKSGEILIDNNNINELDEKSIRGNVTVINQEPYIFNMSIRDNLQLVKENLTDEEMIEACKDACLDKYIDSLPNKYDTIVGENGVVLSGGQKQRLAIARALIQKSKIILFDEATSNLDNETQAEIQKTILNLKSQCSILIIAHRLSTIINCDKIMILENGKITDQGSHKELLDRNNTYKTLYQTEILK